VTRPVPLPMLARIRPVVSSPSLVSRAVAPRDPAARGRLTAVFVSLVLLTAACGGALPTPEVKGPTGRQFVPMVPDSIDNVGIAPSVTIDGEGLPNIYYFGFPA